MAEIAQLTDVQLSEIYFRPRDQYGVLIREDSVGANDGEVRIAKVVSYEEMYRGLLKNRGMKAEQIEERWQTWLKKNPKYRGRRS